MGHDGKHVCMSRDRLGRKTKRSGAAVAKPDCVRSLRSTGSDGAWHKRPTCQDRLGTTNWSSAPPHPDLASRRPPSCCLLFKRNLKRGDHLHRSVGHTAAKRLGPLSSALRELPGDQTKPNAACAHGSGTAEAPPHRPLAASEGHECSQGRGVDPRRRTRSARRGHAACHGTQIGAERHTNTVRPPRRRTPGEGSVNAAVHAREKTTVELNCL